MSKWENFFKNSKIFGPGQHIVDANNEYEEYKKMIELFVSKYNSKITKQKELDEFKSLLQKIIDKSSELSFYSNFLDGRKLSEVSNIVFQLTYLKAWVKSFSIVGLEDFKMTSNLDFKVSDNGLLTLINTPKPMSLIRYEKVMNDETLTPYLRNKKLKKTRAQKQIFKKIK